MRISDWSSDVCSSDHEILVEYADGELDLGALRQRASEDIRDDTPEAMARLWEEDAVRFGTDAPDDSCAPPSRNPERPAANLQVQSCTTSTSSPSRSIPITRWRCSSSAAACSPTTRCTPATRAPAHSRRPR